MKLTKYVPCLDEGEYDEIKMVPNQAGKWVLYSDVEKQTASLHSLLSRCEERLRNLKETHQWLWNNCERGEITHTDFFNVNMNEQVLTEELLQEIKEQLNK